MIEMSGQEDYKKQKQKVIDLKKNKEEIPPVELYKLAGLLSRWATSDKLPVCLLCQDSSKKIKQLGHVIPHSMLKLTKDIYNLDVVRGANSSVSKFGYFAFCMDCESKFQQGETHMNPKFFEQFFSNPKEKIEIKTKIEVKGEHEESVNFPWLYYTLVSIVWRCLAVIPDSYDFLEPLEAMRKYLINWNRAEVDQNIKLYLYGPNEAVDKKLQNRPDNKFIFYECFHARFLKEEVRRGWIFLGPLHVYFIYVKDPTSGANCILTAEADTFVIDECKSRLFPDFMIEECCKLAEDLSSARLRVKEGSKKPTTQDAPTAPGKFLHLLPRDVSYNDGKFDFPSNIYKHLFEYVQTNVMKIVGVMIGNKKGIFVSIINACGDGKELAMGLLVQSDGTIAYMNGVNIPQNVYNNGEPLDLSTPPYKEWIEDCYKDFLCEKFDNAK